MALRYIGLFDPQKCETVELKLKVAKTSDFLS